MTTVKTYNGVYEGDRISRVAFPMGGIGAGMIAMEGTGALSHISLRHAPDIAKEPFIFSAVSVKGENGYTARVLEGPVPSWKVLGVRADGFKSVDL